MTKRFGASLTLGKVANRSSYCDQAPKDKRTECCVVFKSHDFLGPICKVLAGQRVLTKISGPMPLRQKCAHDIHLSADVKVTWCAGYVDGKAHSNSWMMKRPDHTACWPLSSNKPASSYLIFSCTPASVMYPELPGRKATRCCHTSLHNNLSSPCTSQCTVCDVLSCSTKC